MENKKIRVLIINSTLHIGGAEYVISSLCKNIDSSKFDVSICLLKEGGVVADELKRLGFNVIVLEKNNNKLEKYLSSLKLRKIIIDGEFDIIHSHDLHSFVDSSICRLIVRSVRHVHTYHFGNYPHKEKKYRVMEYLCGRWADLLVAVGNEQKKKIISTYKFTEAKIISIWNGVDAIESTHIDERLIEINKTGKITIGCISTLIKQKGLFVMIDAISKLYASRSDFNVVVAGGGHLLDELVNKVDELGLNDVIHFLGWVPNANQSILPEIDIFLQTSLWEAMSMVVIEAMSAGKCLIVSDVGENSHVVINNETGIVVPVNNIDSVVTALEKMLNNEQLRSCYSSAAYKRYEKLLTGRCMTMKYEEQYMKLVS